MGDDSGTTRQLEDVGLGGLGLMLSGVGLALLRQRSHPEFTQMGLGTALDAGEGWTDAAQQRLAELRIAIERLRQTVQELQQSSGAI
jgi:hypothetical protein